MHANIGVNMPFVTNPNDHSTTKQDVRLVSLGCSTPEQPHGIRNFLTQNKHYFKRILTLLAFTCLAVANLSGSTPQFPYFILKTQGGLGVGSIGYCDSNNCLIKPFYSLPAEAVGVDGQALPIFLAMIPIVTSIAFLSWLAVWTRYWRQQRRAKDNSFYRAARRWSCTIAWASFVGLCVAMMGAWGSAMQLTSSSQVLTELLGKKTASTEDSKALSDANMALGYSYGPASYIAIAGIVSLFLWATLESASMPTPDGRTSGLSKFKKAASWWNPRPQWSLLMSSRFWSMIVGIFYIIVQVSMAVHDFKAMTWSMPWESVKLESDPLCAYYPETSLVKQGTQWEVLFGFVLHNTWIVIIAFCMILDEWTNCRFGLMAPQQHKGGIHWTGIYLFTDLFSRHLRQGNKAQVEFTYVAGWACFGFNILHVMLSVLPTSTDSQRLRANRQKAMDQYSKHLSEPRDCSPPPIPFPRIAALINKSVDDIEELSVEEHRSGKDKPRREAQAARRKNVESFNFIRGFPTRVERIVTVRKYPKDEDEATEERDGFHPWFDGRRILTLFISGCLAIIQMLLLCHDVGFVKAHDMSEQYIDAMLSWNSLDLWTTTTLESRCMFYTMSAVPIHPSMGKSPLFGAFISVAIYGFNRFFLLMMCLCVMHVSVANQRFWGQRIGCCYSLIGPRNSSFSVGFTLAFVGVSTVTTAMFPDNEYGFHLCRIVCYSAMAVGVLCFFVSEDYSGQADKSPRELKETDHRRLECYRVSPRKPFIKGAVKRDWEE